MEGAHWLHVLGFFVHEDARLIRTDVHALLLTRFDYIIEILAKLRQIDLLFDLLLSHRLVQIFQVSG